MSDQMQLTILEMKKPVLNVNVAEVKEHLAVLLKDYTGVIVTEETLEACKGIQKDLSKLAKDIDERRKEVKKEFTKPITDFDAECKELSAMIDKVNAPIKEGIKVFDDKRREAKKEVILDIIDDLGKDLNDKYFDLLTVDEKYLNVTTTMKAIKADIADRVANLKVMQDAEVHALQAIRQQIEMVNDMLQLAKPLEESEFKHLLKGEINVAAATAEITRIGKSRKEAETAAAERAVQPKPQPEFMPQPPVEVADALEDQETEILCLDITCTAKQRQLIIAFLDTNNIEFEVVED